MYLWSRNARSSHSMWRPGSYSSYFCAMSISRSRPSHRSVHLSSRKLHRTVLPLLAVMQMRYSAAERRHLREGLDAGKTLKIEAGIRKAFAGLALGAWLRGASPGTGLQSPPPIDPGIRVDGNRASVGSENSSPRRPRVPLSCVSTLVRRRRSSETANPENCWTRGIAP